MAPLLQPQAPALVNFDFTDIANGTGYEIYFLIESEDSGGVDYHLTPQRDFSNSVLLRTNSSAVSDIDFDLTPFVIPRTINGTVLISLAMDSSFAVSTSFTAELYRWDGSSETLISDTVTFSKSIGPDPEMLYFTAQVTNQLVPAGETLRFRLRIAPAAQSSVALGIDPANRADVLLTITTTSKISVPYKLDS